MITRENGKTIVDLNDAPPTLIIPSNTGVVYRNQAGCVSCLQMEVEGYAIPIDTREIELLADRMCENTYHRYGYDNPDYYGGFQRVVARALQHVGLKLLSIRNFTEAWATLEVAEDLGPYANAMSFSAILSWTNCD